MDADYPNTGVNLACRFTTHSLEKQLKSLAKPLFKGWRSGRNFKANNFMCSLAPAAEIRKGSADINTYS